MPMAPKRAPNLPLGSCYKYSENYLIKYCPYPRQPNLALAVLALARYCLECGIKHFFYDCPLNLENKGKAIGNLLETIPLSSGKSKGTKPINVVIRAQAKKQVA